MNTVTKYLSQNAFDKYTFQGGKEEETVAGSL